MIRSRWLFSTSEPACGQVQPLNDKPTHISFGKMKSAAQCHCAAVRRSTL